MLTLMVQILGGESDLYRLGCRKAQWWDTAQPYHYVRTYPENDYEVLIVGGEDHPTGQSRSKYYDAYAKLEGWARERFPMAQEVLYRWTGQVGAHGWKESGRPGKLWKWWRGILRFCGIDLLYVYRKIGYVRRKWFYNIVRNKGLLVYLQGVFPWFDCSWFHCCTQITIPEVPAAVLFQGRRVADDQTVTWLSVCRDPRRCTSRLTT